MRTWFGAGIAAGVAMFIWGAISHMLLPIGDMGMKPLPDEAAVLTQLGDKIKVGGVYFFPGADAGNDMEKISQAYAKSPHGLMAYTPSDGRPLSMGMPLTIQFVTDVICGILAAWLLWHALPALGSFASKVAFVAVIGLAAIFAISAPHWNWYGFGGGFFAGQLIDRGLAFTIGGCVLAWLMRRELTGVVAGARSRN